jgi:hypothetical protein
MSMIEATLEIESIRGYPLWNASESEMDRRESRRIAQDLSAELVGVHDRDPIRCMVKDWSKGGMYLFADPACGLSVGQRYEIALATPAAPATPAAGQVDGCYATVVRTELVSRVDGPRIGAGIRFDQPLLL